MKNHDSTHSAGEPEAGGSGFIQAVNGGHLHWSDFRDDVLEPFGIRCIATADASRLPSNFLAQLQRCQGNLSKYESQRQAWLLDVTCGRGFNTSNIYPPNLMPPIADKSIVSRCVFPKLSREDLPLRGPDTKDVLYELPTAKPSQICGFKMQIFEKREQAQLGGALTATGTVIDFEKAEVLPNQQLACPFLAFEGFEVNTEQAMETARNACAVTGAQCLRGQQQLLHKAYGLQTISQPPITFTCAVNNQKAIMNCHYVDDDGSYIMAGLCKFDLDNKVHFHTFQAWIEAIEGWAVAYLLPRLKGAVGQVMLANPSPPPSPAPTSSSYLSINTNPDNLSSTLSVLRQLWPMVSWHNDVIGETPINSSIAQCGTPLPMRQIRGQLLPRPPDSSTSLSSPDALRDARVNSSLSQRLTLMPLHTDLPISARPRVSLHSRRLSSASAVSRFCVGSTPNSPCRPPSLSPCTPGPEAPASSKSPMLVLQKRLELAMAEIQDLRGQVDELEGHMTGRTEIVERRLEIMMERQDEIERFMCDHNGNVGEKKSKGGWVRQLEALVEEELRTPVPGYSMSAWEDNEVSNDCASPVSPSVVARRIPGHLSAGNAEEEMAMCDQPWLTEELVIWCLAVVMRDEKVNLGAIMIGALMMCCSGLVDQRSCTGVALMFAMDTYAKRAVWHVCARMEALYKAAQMYKLHEPYENTSANSGRAIEEVSEDVSLVLA